MPYWIEIFTTDGPLLGSDGTIRLDGRYGYQRAVEEGFAHCRSLLRVKPHIAGFVISTGNRPSALYPRSKPFHLAHYTG